MRHTTDPIESAHSEDALRISLPDLSDDVDQDEEWFEVEVAGRRSRLRMHDYAALYEVPGLYESLVYRTLKCQSPDRVVRPLEEAVAAGGRRPEELRVVDLGAGNGIVGELLRNMGVREILAVDILPEAAGAARRDRPRVYDDYIVADLAEPDAGAEERLRDFAPNCLVSVASLGYGDTPPAAFVKVFNALPIGGWVALCIKDRFLEADDETGFGRLLRELAANGTIEIVRRQRYVHRISIAGDPLHYVALIARKHAHADWPR